MLDYYGPPPLQSTYGAALQAAINAASSAGGTVIVPPGSYPTGDSSAANINPASGIVITGYGATLIQTNPGISNSVFSYNVNDAGSLSNLTIEGLTIDLNANTAAGSAVALNGNSSSYAIYDVLLKDLTVLCSSYTDDDNGPDAQAAISVGGVNDESFTDNHSERIHVDHCTFLNGNTGSKESLRLVSCDESSITNCKFYNVSTVNTNNFTASIGVYAYCNGVIVRGNVTRACNGFASLQQGQNIVLTGNQARNGANEDGTNFDVFIRNAQNVQVVGNSFFGQALSTAFFLNDTTTPFFDGWPPQFSHGANIVLGSNIVNGYTSGAKAANDASGEQSYVAVTNNVFSNVTTAISLPAVTNLYTENNP